MKNISEKMRQIPAVDRLLAAVATETDIQEYPRQLVAEALRQATESIREQLKQGFDAEISISAIIGQARKILRDMAQPSLKPVINATGVVLHTNLGRAPLSVRAIAEVQSILGNYSTLEFDINSGGRGSRYSHVVSRLCSLTGAEDALVVNNNAAAVLLVLTALASGREVIVSRGQLVEIGGSFRVPEVIKQGGANLVEVGTTNKTHLRDYEQAIGENTAAILKVHTSNYRIIGFTAEPDDAALVTLAHDQGIPIVEDLGSGTLLPVTIGGWHEPSVTEKIVAGIDVVTFSGDKLLGAGQAGIIVGKAKYIQAMKKHPLLRAIRIDKLSLAALEGTLMDYSVGGPADDIPVHKMLFATEEELKRQAEQLAEMLGCMKNYGWTVTTMQLESLVGGGAFPGVGLISYGVGVVARQTSSTMLEKLLRCRKCPIITRIQDEQVLFDVRCLLPGDMEAIVEACVTIAEGEHE